MITVKNINGSPESIPDVKIYGTHSDEQYFYFFTTEKEAEAHDKEVAASAVQAPPQPLNISQVDINTLTNEQIQQLKTRLGL